jgi:ferritin
MLSKALHDAINSQIQAEFSSGYLYLSMAAYFDSINLSGMASWMRAQYREEVSHGMRLYEYLNSRGARVVLKEIEAPKSSFKSPREAFEITLAHEGKVTGMINKLYEMALKEKDYPTQVELQWFIKEQVEEEKMVSGIVEQLKMIGDQGTPLLMLDRALAARASS